MSILKVNSSTLNLTHCSAGNQCNLPYDRRYLVMGFAVMDEVG